MERRHSTVGVAGAGLMGIGIATRFAAAGHRAILYDASPEQLDRVLQHVEAIVGELLASGSISAEQARAVPNRVSLCHVVHELHEASIVFEAIKEDVQLKRHCYAELETVLSEGAIIASNTSGFLPDALSAEMRNPERFAIAHFWNPPHVISLVEIVPGTRTSGQTTRALAESLGSIGMEPVVLERAIPGFIGNRLQFAVLREALHIVRAGVAEPAVVDTVMQACLGRRYRLFGPFESADIGGLDTLLGIAKYLMPALAKDEGVLALMQARVDGGDTGIASGRGFYEWTESRKADVRERRLQSLCSHDAGRSTDANQE